MVVRMPRHSHEPSPFQLRTFCPFCENWGRIMSSGLCVDCELKGALYRASRKQFERAVLVERRTKTQQSNDKTNNTHFHPLEARKRASSRIVRRPPDKGWIAWRQVKRE